MLPTPTNPEADDIGRLRDEGYDVAIQSGYLLVHSVPYVTSAGHVERGTLVAPLNMPDGQTTAPPRTHVVMFTGEQPCDRHGRPIGGIALDQLASEPVPGVHVRRRFSNRPKTNVPKECSAAGYCDYHQMMTRYADIISVHAAAVEPGATARIYPPLTTQPGDDSPFVYQDTASTRAGVSDLSRRLALGKVVIIGLGGTGSYVLDLVAKTPVREIHLYDGDHVASHNAFRAPGAMAVSVLRERPNKVDYFARVYSEMHRGIVPHAVYVTQDNASELTDADFVFVCLDKNEPKKAIFDALEEAGVPFVDVGLGLVLGQDRMLGGQVRVTASTDQNRTAARTHVSFADRDEEEDLYHDNIQIAGLNMLNAAFAVERWMKHFGFYRDAERPHHSVYIVDSHDIIHAESVPAVQIA